jgi:hypothetical protein
MADRDRADAEHAAGNPDTTERPTDERHSRLTDVASSIAGGAGSVLSAALRPVGEVTSGARRAFGERTGARVRRVREMGQRPLANLWELHPEARRAPIRERGLCAVPVDQICGTAVEGPIQRGGDFLPVRERRGQDWRARWQRIRDAVDNLVVLPPVDLLKVGDCFWVVDGHNRVAAALYTGQVAIDANVTELRLPGQAGTTSSGHLAEYLLESSQDLRAAGAGRLTRTTVRSSPVHGHDLGAHAADDNADAHDRPVDRPDDDDDEDTPG